MVSQVDAEGHTKLSLEEIIDHRTNDEAVKKEKSSNVDPNNESVKRKRTTKGWDLCVLWKGGNTFWVALKDMKNGYPVQTA